jgi:hypothetical protein
MDAARSHSSRFAPPRSSPIRLVNPECFYLLIAGEQRGPYTIAQIDHQLNSKLIPEDVTFWREGMEDWQPITNLVAIRKPVRHWRRRAILIALLLIAAFFARLFGPIAIVGWRETAQYDFTARAAYWRARDQVRHQVAPPGAVISFSGFDASPVNLGDRSATVRLHAHFTGVSGPEREGTWEVKLAYDPTLKMWTGTDLTEVKP